MEAFLMIAEAFHIVHTATGHLQAAESCTKTFARASNNVGQIRKQLEILDGKLTSSEEELLSDWKLDCEDILAQLQARSGPSFELHNVGFRKAVAAAFRRLCFNPKEADRLNIRLSTDIAHLSVICNFVQLARNSQATRRPPLVLTITEDDLPRSLGQRYYED